MRYHVIALDLDGTLLTPQKTILPASLNALRDARAAGVKVLIVTGRHHVAIHPFYQALGLDTPAICCNGSYLYDYPARQVLASNPLRTEQARQLVTLLETYQIEGLMYVDDAMLYPANSEKIAGHVARTRAWASSLPEAQRPVFKEVSSLRDSASTVDNIWKFALIDSDLPKLRQFTEQVESTLGLSGEWSWQDQVDITQHGNSKGARLAEWVAQQGLSMDQVVAFGDNENDLSMLETAGLGVAMGNAADNIKARAKLTIGNNEQASIADAIYRYVL